MKKLFLITISVLYSTLMVSQTFNTLYNTPDDIIFEDFIKVDSAYVFAGNKVANTQPIFAWFDLQGNLIKDSVDLVSLNWVVKNIVTMDSGFILVETNNTSPQETIRIKVCNSQFQINRQYNYNKVPSFGVSKSRLVNDSIFAIAGNIENVNSNTLEYFTAIYFLNLNTGEDTIVTVGIPKIVHFAADVFYMNEQYYVTQSSSEFYNRPNNSLTKVALSRWNADFSLDTIVPIYNSASNKSGAGFYSRVSVLKLSDSTFLMSGRTEMEEFFSTALPYDIGVVMWDTNFTELNAATFGVKDSMALEAFHGLSRFENDSFVYAAGTERFVVNPGGFDASTSYFMLSKMDLNGNVLWTRYYTNNTYLQMYKVMATEDGGAIMMGKSYDYRTANGLENDTWILKVDSNGNMNNTPTAIAENGEISKDNFVFFPNPASNQLTFRQLNSMQKYQLRLFDINGKLIFQAEVNQSEKRIDVSNFAKGFYFYSLTDEVGNQANGKLIKQ